MTDKNTLSSKRNSSKDGKTIQRCPDCGLPLDEKGWHTVRDRKHPVHVGDVIIVGKKMWVQIVP
jgi:hypothetical protein